MIKSNYFKDNEDFKNHFYRFIDWNKVIDLYEDGFRDAKEYKNSGNERLAMSPSSYQDALDFYETILDSTGDLAGNDISQVAQLADREGLKFEKGKVTHPQEMVDVIEKCWDAGVIPTAFKRKYGGLGLPNVMKALSLELFYRADTSIAIAAGSINLSGILEKFAGEEICQEYIPKFIEQKYSITMGLSEPDFGSDLPNVQTKAVKKDDGWYVTGTKRFQTMACGLNGRPAAVLCLARTGDANSGARALSFFIIEGQHLEVTGIEKKLGLKASATCDVAFDNAPAVLVGEEGYGLVKYVIGMLNGARMSVAAQGAGIATAAYFEAKKYAEERIQFGKKLVEIPAVAKMLNRMEREIAAMRCLMVEAALSVDNCHWRAEYMKDDGKSDREIRNDETVKSWERIANALTPMSKYYNSEICNSITYDAIQVFGGSGFIEDYDVARLYRDARITNIYDGTTQIQINAAIGGVVAGMSEKGAFRKYLVDFMQSGSYSDEVKELFTGFEEGVELYRSSTPQQKDEYSFEIVEMATRLVNGLLLEKTTAMLDGNDKEHRTRLTSDYHLDSLALYAGTLVKLKSKSLVVA